MIRIPPSYWFFGLCLAWLLPGLIGHVPWKGADTEIFAELLRSRELGNWLFPGSIENFSPLYLWITQAFATGLSAILSLHDAARLASGALAGLSLWLTALAARGLYGDEAGWPAAFALMGCVGLLVPAHEIGFHIAQIAALSLFLYGLVRLLSQALIGGGLAGLGLSALFLSGAWVAALLLVAAMLLLPVIFPSWRTSSRMGGSWFALSVVLALCGSWLLAAQGHYPGKLHAWWNEATHAAFGGTSAKYNPFYFVQTLSWFAWPVWPVAGWAVYRLKREGWDSIKLWLPLGVFLIAFVALSLQENVEQIQAIILLPPLALLTGAGLAELKRGAANALMWFSIMLFSFLGLVFWVYWGALDLGVPAQLARRAAKLGMESQGLRLLAMSVGVAVTLFWITGLAWIRSQPRVPQRPILLWSAGVVFVWCLFAALFMGPLDGRLGYAGIAGEIKTQTGNACVMAKHMDETYRQLLRYHGNIDLRSSAQQDCDWFLIYGKGRKDVSVTENWSKWWEGHRPGEKNEHFLLYRRVQ